MTTNMATKLSHRMLHDERLSLEARGLLGSLLSRPTGRNMTPAQIQAMGGIGRDKTYKLIKELIAAGYCATRQARLPNGRLGPIEYHFTDCPEGGSR